MLLLYINVILLFLLLKKDIINFKNYMFWYKNINKINESINILKYLENIVYFK